MLVKDFITKDIPVLKSFDTVEYGLGLMDDFKLKHLPLIEDGLYRCLVSEKELLSLSGSKSTVGEAVLFAPSVTESNHLLEALALVARYKLSFLPVILPSGEYVGGITSDGLLNAISDFTNAEAEGSIIMLEVLPLDYSLSDIARLVESNHSHIICMLSHTDKVTGRLLISIKIDLEDASPVIRSFERFNYTVLYYFMKKGMVDDLLEQRMSELMYYINM
jgi:CBS domain-containing protein|nr:CBS domain-containing protein [uncultured Macellibacteroides sp.]